MGGTRGWRWSFALLSSALSLLLFANFAAAQSPNASPEGTSDAKEKDSDKNGEKDSDASPKDQAPPWYSVHGQATVVSQAHDPFHSPYVGTNSLLPRDDLRTSETSTLYLAMRLCDWGEIVFDPEVAGGTGFSEVHGIAGFSNGEITRVGNPSPTPYIARLFYRRTFGLGGEQEKIEDEANQIAGAQDVSRITLTLGKMAATDLFDKNRYSSDPREQFLDWALMFNGGWDYPADVRGYTIGGTIEWNEKDWAFRYGIFGEPSVANGVNLDSHVIKANGHVWEAEWRYTLRDSPGKLRLLSYLNNAHMGSYQESLELAPTSPDITATRAYRVKYGFGINLEQELTDNLGMFLRAGWNDGHTETWAFTEIDRTLAIGFVLKGASWSRSQDEFGFAGVINGLSSEHRAYLAAGGLGFILGDGQLNYAPEQILETYYNWELKKNLNVTPVFQFVANPAYNQDRGPVAIGTLRVHYDF